MNHRFDLYTHYTNTSHCNLANKSNIMVNPGTTVKRRFTAKNAQVIRKKAFAGAELVTAGAALIGGVMLLEEATKPKDPPVVGHDNVYATDNGATLFEV